jgi:hypothetical protein
MAEVLEGHIREHLGAEGLTPEEWLLEVDTIAGAVRSYLK